MAEFNSTGTSPDQKPLLCLLPFKMGNAEIQGKAEASPAESLTK